LVFSQFAAGPPDSSGVGITHPWPCCGLKNDWTTYHVGRIGDAAKPKARHYVHGMRSQKDALLENCSLFIVHPTDDS
jgi:hypothetical protein